MNWTRRGTPGGRLDQTSCHNPFNGGYYPVQLSRRGPESLASDPTAFKGLVQEVRRRAAPHSVAHAPAGAGDWVALPRLVPGSQLCGLCQTLNLCSCVPASVRVMRVLFRGDTGDRLR